MLVLLSAKTLKFVFKNPEKEENINLPVIEPLKENIKEKPDEVELFPHSDSSIWKEFKKNSETMDNKRIESSNLEANRENNNIDKKNNTSIEVETNVAENKEANIVKEEKKDLNDDKNNTQLKSTKSVAKEKTAVAKEKNNNENIDKGYFFIQLASVTDMKLIEPEWKRLNKIYIELSKMKYNYKRVQLKNGKIFFRLFVGEFDTKEEAKDFCKMALKKNTCIIKYYE